MIHPPQSMETTVSQAIAATFSALDAGCSRLLIDLRFPELKQLPTAHLFAQAFMERYQDQWQALFADAGSAALARRDWPDIPITLRGINEGRRAMGESIQAFLLVVPTSIELDQIEKLLVLAENRPFVLLNPQLENAEVGIGLSARRMRERFLSTFEVAYFLQPLPEGMLWRCYPQGWQIWQDQESAESLTLVAETPTKPSGEDINRLFAKSSGKSLSWLDRVQSFINALSR